MQFWQKVWLDEVQIKLSRIEAKRSQSHAVLLKVFVQLLEFVAFTPAIEIFPLLR